MSQVAVGPVTEPLRAEHRHLYPHVEALAEAAAAVGFAETREQRAKVDAAYEFLAGHLIPHAVAEDLVLYPVLDRLIGVRDGTRATDTMRRDHVEVSRLTEQLGRLRGGPAERELDAGEQSELRRLLYGLHALVVLHFAKEEEVYLPLLDRELTADEARELFERMEQIGAQPGAVAGH
jgi:iron-sulfur cluster repair protein YtfE (RIC family)